MLFMFNFTFVIVLGILYTLFGEYKGNDKEQIFVMLFFLECTSLLSVYPITSSFC